MDQLTILDAPVINPAHPVEARAVEKQKEEPKPAEVGPSFCVGDLVTSKIQIPYMRPPFVDQACWVTKVDDEYVWAKQTSKEGLPPQPFYERELRLLAKGE